MPILHYRYVYTGPFTISMQLYIAFLKSLLRLIRCFLTITALIQRDIRSYCISNTYVIRIVPLWYPNIHLCISL